MTALMPQSAPGHLRAFLPPPAVVALPDRDRRSLFIPLRQFSAAVTGPPECAGWTAEVRIPVQPGSARGASLAGITAAAYQRAIMTLGASAAG